MRQTWIRRQFPTKGKHWRNRICHSRKKSLRMLKEIIAYAGVMRAPLSSMKSGFVHLCCDFLQLTASLWFRAGLVWKCRCNLDEVVAETGCNVGWWHRWETFQRLWGKRWQFLPSCFHYWEFNPSLPHRIPLIKSHAGDVVLNWGGSCHFNDIS